MTEEQIKLHAARFSIRSGISLEKAETIVRLAVKKQWRSL